MLADQNISVEQASHIMTSSKFVALLNGLEILSALLVLTGLSFGIVNENYNIYETLGNKFIYIFAPSLLMFLLGIIKLFVRQAISGTNLILYIIFLFPLVISGLLLSTVPGVVAIFGIVRSADVLVKHMDGRIWSVVLYTGVIVLPICLLLAVFLPNYGVMQDAYVGAWKGVFAQKNRLGFYASLMMILALTVKNHPQWFRLLMILASVLILFKSQSSNAMLSLAAVLALLIFHKFIKNELGKAMVVLSLLLLLAIGSQSIFNLVENVIGSVGRDLTLTGRTDIWQILIEGGYINEFGYGLNYFWSNYNSSANEIANYIGWRPFYSHNGYIEMLLIYGFIPSILIILALAVTYILLYRNVQNLRTEYSVMSLLIMYNMGEAVFFQYDNIACLIFFVALQRVIVYIGKERVQWRK